MKLFIALLIFTSLLHSRTPLQGESVSVELKSGIKQNAKFEGFASDTVLLGGYIKDNYTIVRIPKTSFVQILSNETGDTLSLQDTIQVQNDSTSTWISDSTIPKDTVKILIQDSSSHKDSLFFGKTVLVPFTKRPIDSSLCENVQNILFRLLQEEKQNPMFTTDSMLENCTEISCVLPLTRTKEAKATLFGSISPLGSDSLRIEMSYFLKDQEPEEFQLNIPSKFPLTTILTENLFQEAISTFLKKEPPIKKIPDTVFVKPKFNYVSVETEPEGAILTLAGKNAICKTPCTYATKDTGTVELYAYWDVDYHLWADTRKVKILPNDTTKISMNLKRVNPKIQLITIPENAEIYPNDTITSFTAKLGNTPKILERNHLGETSLFITKEGFRDTTIHFYMMPSEKNRVEVKLSPLNTDKEIEIQKQKLKEKRQKKIGITLIGTSLVPFVTGTVFAYLSARDYQKAKDKRDELKKPHIANGENYKELQKENKDLAERSDERAYISIASFAAAIGLLSAGIIISF